MAALTARYCCETHELIDRFLRWSLRGQRDEAFCLGFTTTQAYLLCELLCGGDLTMAELGGRLGLARSTMTRVIDALERRGVVARRATAGDRRAVLVGLTDEGRRQAEELAGCFKDVWERVIERIPAERREQVTDAIRLLLRAVEDVWQRCCDGEAGGDSGGEPAGRRGVRVARGSRHGGVGDGSREG